MPRYDNSTASPLSQRVWEWLARLHALTAGGSSADEAEARIMLVAPMLAERFGLEAFTQRSLEHVASKCRFWPSYGELVQHLGEWRRSNASGAARLGYDGPLKSAVPEGRGAPCQEEVAYVASLLTSHRHELARAAVERAELEPRPVELRDVSLKGEALRISRQRRGIVVGERP